MINLVLHVRFSTSNRSETPESAWFHRSFYNELHRAKNKFFIDYNGNILVLVLCVSPESNITPQWCAPESPS